MCPPSELQRLELASDAPAVVSREKFRPLDVVDAAPLARDLRSANDESPDDAPAASAANAHRDLSRPRQLLPGQGSTDLGAVPQWTSHSLRFAAGRHRSRVLGAFALELARRSAAALSAARTRWQQTRRAKAVYAALARLDHRTLRDLGLHRSDAGFVRPAPLDVWQDGPNVYDRIRETKSLVPR
jgi:uncharacterized protein YjiS (DUF1127 family)